MNRDPHPWAVVAAGVTAALLIPAAIVVSVVVGADAPDTPHRPPAVSTPLVEARTMDESGQNKVNPSEPAGRLAAHQTMLEQMRVNVTPQMIQTMNASPMVHSTGDLAELERHAADIDRMLARNQ